MAGKTKSGLPPVRLDSAYSREVVTPHVKWADPFVNGPLRPLIVNGVMDGRGVVELMQRMEMEPRVVTIDADFGMNRWWGDRLRYKRIHSVDIDPEDYTGTFEILQEELNRPVRYDAIMMHSILGWNHLPASIRTRIYARVKAGEGLVLVHPQLGMDESDKQLWEVSPIINVPATKLGQRAAAQYPKEAMSGEPWRKAADHYLVNGIPFEAFPYPALQHFKYELAPGAQALATGADGCPVIAVKKYGKGRVVGLAYHAQNIWPTLDAKRWDTKEDFWEYLCALLMRSLIWASGKEPAVQLHGVMPSPGRVSAEKAAGEKVTLRLSNAGEAANVSVAVTVRDEQRKAEQTSTKRVKLAPGEREITLPIPAAQPGGGRHFVDVIVSQEGKTCDWGAGLYDVRKEARLGKIRLDQEGVAAGETLTGTVKVTGAARGMVLTAELWDTLGRLLARQEKKVWRASAVPIALKCLDAQANTGIVVCALCAGDRVVDRVRKRTALAWDRPAKWTDYEVQMPWHHAGFYPWSYVFQDAYASAGITAAGSPDFTFWLTADVQFHGFGGGWWERGEFIERRQAYGETHDKKYLIRQPSCFDSEADFRRPLAKAIATGVARRRKYRPWEVLICDESSVTKYADAFDLCWCEDTLRLFRAWLKRQYRTLDALNEEWGTRYKDWAKVRPITWEEAQARGNPAPWVDHRLYMNQSFANAFACATAACRKADPGALATVCGTQVPGSHNGCDWWLVDNVIDYIQPYSGGAQHEMHRCFNPNLIISGFTGYDRHGITLQHELWMRFFHGHDGAAIFWGISFVDPDLTLNSQGESMRKNFGELRGGGIYRTIRELARDNDGIAVHYSMASGHVWWIQDGKLTYGDTLEFSNDSSACFKRFMDNRLRWGYALEDIGYQYDWMPYARLEEGGLKGYRALVLPGSIALSDKEVSETIAFVKRGGLLLADMMPGTTDEHGQPRVESPLAELFAAGGCGKGAAVLLNEWISDVPQEDRAKRNAAAQGAKLRRLLEEFGLRPAVALTDATGKHPARVERVSWRDARVEVIGLLRELEGDMVPSADGVVEFHASKKGAAPLAATVRASRAGHWYDLRRHAYLGKQQELRTSIEGGEPHMYGVLPYRVSGVSLTAPARAARGEAVGYTVQIEADDAKLAKHVVIIEVIGPDRQKRRIYSGTAETKNGQAAGEFWLALNEQPGKWQLIATDSFSGKRSVRTMEVK